MKFAVGDFVKKTKGYAYFGIVVAAFKTHKTQEDRYVVESIATGSLGMLFIFNQSQLEPY